MHDWLLEIWYGGGRGGAWLRPLGRLYAALAALRRGAYRRGWLPRYRSRRLVVVVGNLTVGGTGKTPFVLWLAGELVARGLRVGIATRGYRGARARAHRVSPNEDSASAGDEAVLLRRRLGVPVAVGARRADVVRLLEPDCELIVCDDGLQHYGLERDLEIAVIDGSRGLGNGRPLPAGPLREPAERLAEVDAVVVHGPGFTWPGACSMELVPLAAVSLADGARRPLASLAGRRVQACAAIGNPERFFATLRAAGLKPTEHAFRDHSRLALESIPVDDGSVVLMTEKDAVKYPGGPREAWYVETAARVEGPAAARLLDRVARLARGHHAGDGTGA